MNPKFQQTRELYCFGAFRLDAAERRLWCDDAPVALTPKQFDLLFYFIENAGRVMKKSELLDAVWAETYIEESTLARNVSWLRKLLEDGSNGEKFIETVSKSGYRFTAEVTRLDETPLIIEEQTVQYARGEEIISFNDAELTRTEETKSARSFAVYVLPILLVVFSLIVGSGFFLYRNQQKSPAESRADVISKRSSSEGQQINIGSIVQLQNRSSNDGSYLDAWGLVSSNPQFFQVPTEIMFVSTHKNPNRDNGSGSWKIVSASGKSNGESLAVGDRIHLKNMHPNAGYLDTCGWIIHLPRIFYKYSDQTAAVFTTISEDRDNGSGTWTVRSATNPQGTLVLEGDSIALESNLNMDDTGKVRIAGFLNAAGDVKDIPSFNNYEGASLVFTQNRSNGQPILDIWTITISKAVLK